MINYYCSYLTNHYINEFIYLTTIFILVAYMFLIFTFFLLLNTFDTRFIKNLSDLKKFGTIFPFNFLFLITILSFAGVPPLFGFSIKLFVFLLLINSSALFYMTTLTLFNFFTLYFYIQNVRYIINNSPNNFYIYANNFVVLSDVVMFVLLFSLLINITGILYLADVSVFLYLFTV